MSDLQKAVQEAMDKVESIPGDDGWWKHSSQRSYARLLVRLKEFEIEEESALAMLREAYWAAANCYGA